MEYHLFIPYVNRPDLLEQAVKSLHFPRERITVIDNSPHGLRLTPPLEGINVERGPIPYTFTQTQNIMQLLARKRGCDVLMFMHNDGECVPGASEAFLEVVEHEHRTNENWGLIFTHYDVLCAFNRKCVDRVGEWDTEWRQYKSDIDFYHRVRRSGFEVLLRGDKVRVLHHNSASSTIKADPLYDFLQRFRNTWEMKYYLLKWGGDFGHETFVHPYDGVPQVEALRRLQLTPTFEELNKLAPAASGDLLAPIHLPATTRNVLKQIRTMRSRRIALRESARLRARLLARTELLAEYLRAIRATGATPHILEVGNSKGHFGLLLTDLAPRARLQIFSSALNVDRVVAALDALDSISVMRATSLPNDGLDLVWLDPENEQEFPRLLEQLMQQNARHIFVIRGLSDRREQMQQLLNRFASYRLEHAPYRETDTLSIAVLSLRTTTGV